MDEILYEFVLLGSIEMVEASLKTFASDHGYKAETTEDFERHKEIQTTKTPTNITVFAPGGAGSICTFRLSRLPREKIKMTVIANKFLKPPEPPEIFLVDFVQTLVSDGFLPEDNSDKNPLGFSGHKSI